ncbi:terminase small subunit [Acidovorax sp. NCPPB 4044]|uniref:terminase small subunit n=1 Tax=Acidovorax sp. NCPPB 4044 TaxID=2940490 RepID=UPI002302DF4F|nr:terminase small subunit [Acidovorax sp. NCPPB 4044]MDA8521990.1 terminase small subunit [Acidovorax sp. NCPPB 4044]
MPRGGARPGAGRPKKSAPADVPKPAAAAKKRPASKKTEAPPLDAEGYKTDANWPFGQERPLAPPPPKDLSDLTPLDFLLEVMRDETEERRTRIQAAQLAAPYVHAKKGEAGKKEEKQDAAKKVASRFTAGAPPPKLAAAGGKRV